MYAKRIKKELSEEFPNPSDLKNTVGEQRMKKEPWDEFPYPSDLKITVGETTINCHKPFLGSKSPVFKAMFQTNVAEKDKNTLTIEDIDEKTFLIFLRYLYAPENKLLLEDLSIELLYTANKYMVSSLIEVFNNNSEAFVNEKNAIECIRVANQNETTWRKKLLEFAAHNDKFIRNSDNFKLLKKEVDFMVDLFEKMIFDPELDMSHVREERVAVYFHPSATKPSSFHSQGGWILTFENDKKSEYIAKTNAILSITREDDGKFNNKYHYFVKIGKQEACTLYDGYYTSPDLLFSCHYDGSSTPIKVLKRNVSLCHNSYIVINYWKLEKSRIC